jgi:hypothetical protein
MKQLVRGWLASPCSVPPIFALKSPVLRGFVEGKRGVALPSEGRGHRFESCRVRQSLQRVMGFFGAHGKTLVQWFVRATLQCCHCVPEAFYG